MCLCVLYIQRNVYVCVCVHMYICVCTHCIHVCIIIILLLNSVYSVILLHQRDIL